MIKITNVTKHYDDFKVLDEINIHIKKGAIYGLIGPNGASWREVGDCWPERSG